MNAKILILNILILGNVLQLNAQQDFPVLSARWCYHGYGDIGEDLGNYCFTPTELVEVSGHTYSRISYRSHPSGTDLLDVLYREEDRRFYIIPQDSLSEILVYDFNLEVGDIFQTDWGWGIDDSISLVVENVDTIITLDGVSRKRITLENGGYQGTWIEGIGSLDWVFVLPAYEVSTSGGFNFTCHSQNESLIYLNSGSGEDCDFVNEVSAQSSEIEFDLYPNPLKDKINIDLKNIDGEYLMILDLTGKTILMEIIKNGRNLIQIPNDLKPGIYLLQITRKDDSVLMKKFIKM